MKRAVFAACAAALSMPNVAHADVTLLSPGLTLGTARGRKVIGAELSIVRTPSIPHSGDVPMPIVWFGGYVDGVYDSRTERARFSLGPEFGIGPVGVDGGLVVQTGGRPLGATFRLLYGIGFVMGYARWLFVDDPFASAPVREYGILLKLPIFPLHFSDPGLSEPKGPRPSPQLPARSPGPTR